MMLYTTKQQYLHSVLSDNKHAPLINMDFNSIIIPGSGRMRHPSAATNRHRYSLIMQCIQSYITIVLMNRSLPFFHVYMVIYHLPLFSILHACFGHHFLLYIFIFCYYFFQNTFILFFYVLYLYFIILIIYLSFQGYIKIESVFQSVLTMLKHAQKLN